MGYTYESVAKVVVHRGTRVRTENVFIKNNNVAFVIGVK